MAQVPNLSSSSNSSNTDTTDTVNAGQSSQTPNVPSLQDIQADITKIQQLIENEYRTSPALSFVKQKLKEAASSITQEMRNLTIEAQEKERELAAAAKKKGL